MPLNKIIVFSCLLYFLPLQIVFAGDPQILCGTPNIAIPVETLQNLDRLKKESPRYRQFRSTKNVQIGQSSSFNTYNFETEKYIQISATLRASQSNINIWVEDTEWANNHVNLAVVNSILDGLINHTPSGSVNPNQGIVEIIHNDFGTPPDFDQDGITDFLITDIKDGWTENQGFVAGYFNPIDQFLNGTRIGNYTVSGSNESDILYIDSYPGIYYNNTYRYENVLGTVAHEYQHLIHFNYDIYEENFVNEGQSELSSYLCGYGLREPSRYLRNTKLNLTAWDSALPQSLDHYAKVALWSYYLYEKFGIDVIRRITQSSQPGISGINSALITSGIGKNFNAVLKDFFFCITVNIIQLNPLYGFNLASLQNLRAVPALIINDYPSSSSESISAYSMQVYRFENGDSLAIDLNTSAGINLFVNKEKPDSSNYFNAISGGQFKDDEFGSVWPKEEILVCNTSGNDGNFFQNSDAKQKYYAGKLEYSLKTEPDLRLNFGSSINANQFIVPYDTCKLKSVTFYNHSSSGSVRVHIYSSKLTSGTKPLSVTKNINNILQNGWVSLDLEDLNIIRHNGDTFDIGIEYISDGVMGYAASPVDLSRSFVKEEGSNVLLLLNNYNSGSTNLNGVWMMNVGYLTDLRHKPATNSPRNFTLEIGPSPFPTPGNNSIQIFYEIGAPGRIKIEIYNILGQKVKTIYNNFATGPAGFAFWNGTNSYDKSVSSGTYFVYFTFEGQSATRKILLLR